MALHPPEPLRAEPRADDRDDLGHRPWRNGRAGPRRRGTRPADPRLRARRTGLACRRLREGQAPIRRNRLSPFSRRPECRRPALLAGEELPGCLRRSEMAADLPAVLDLQAERRRVARTHLARRPYRSLEPGGGSVHAPRGGEELAAAHAAASQCRRRPRAAARRSRASDRAAGRLPRGMRDPRFQRLPAAASPDPGEAVFRRVDRHLGHLHGRWRRSGRSRRAPRHARQRECPRRRRSLGPFHGRPGIFGGARRQSGGRDRCRPPARPRPPHHAVAVGAPRHRTVPRQPVRMDRRRRGADARPSGWRPSRPISR